jgi:hypothetical protein
MAHMRSLLDRVRDTVDDDDFGMPGSGPGETRHFPAADLENTQPCRNPLDPAPYPEEEAATEDSGPSFPSLFLPADGGSLADQEMKHSWQRLEALITKCLDTGSTPADTVDMVHAFYCEHIKSEFTDAPDWSKRSIYQHIYRDFDRQATEAIQAVNNAMEFLRAQMAVRREDGTVKLNADNVKLFLAATKTHAGLLDAKRKREKG